MSIEFYFEEDEFNVFCFVFPENSHVSRKKFASRELSTFGQARVSRDKMAWLDEQVCRPTVRHLICDQCRFFFFLNFVIVVDVSKCIVEMEVSFCNQVVSREKRQ